MWVKDKKKAIQNALDGMSFSIKNVSDEDLEKLKELAAKVSNETYYKPIYEMTYEEQAEMPYRSRL